MYMHMICIIHHLRKMQFGKCWNDWTWWQNSNGWSAELLGLKTPASYCSYKVLILISQAVIYLPMLASICTIIFIVLIWNGTSIASLTLVKILFCRNYVMCFVSNAFSCRLPYSMISAVFRATQFRGTQGAASESNYFGKYLKVSA